MTDEDDGQLTSIDALRQLLEETLPQDEIVYALGYGSGVLSQQLTDITKDDDKEVKVIDVIVVVRNSLAFHQANLEQNPHHYPWHMTASSATWWQRHSLETSLFRNPKVYFVVTDRLKYGVVQVQDLLEDLSAWKYLYLAGRMHKPTVEIVSRQQNDDDTEMLIRRHQESRNLPAALAASLLLLHASSSAPLPETTLPPSRVYTEIASLSYSGDFRMSAGAEDPQKINKLVQSPGQLQRFERLYKNAAERLERDGLLHVDTDDWTFDASSLTARKRLFSDLSPSLQPLYQANQPFNDSITLLRSALSSIVAPAARYQSVKGIATAGLLRSAQYAARKLSKGVFRSRK